jgi:hypothetical protein
MKLKRMLGLLLVLIVPWSISTVVAYRAGVDQGMADAKDWQRTTFVLSLAALQNLRAGSVSAATKDMQQICFAHADKIYGDPSFVDDEFMMFCTSQLITYFDTYCTNRAKWTREEKLLDKHLATMRGR